MTTSTYATLVSVDVRKHVEQKGRFSYLSWTHALHELLTRYPGATWGHDEWGPPEARVPYVKAPGEGYLVRAWCEVDGIRRSVQHAVTNDANRPIAAPSCDQISNAIQRATVKAIALHGLGLSVYAGEDLPVDGADRPSGPSSPAGASGGTGSDQRGQQRSQGEGRASGQSTTSDDLATKAQTAMLQRLMVDLGFTGDGFRSRIAEIVGRPATSEDITKREASKVIEELKAERDAKKPKNGTEVRA